MGSLRGKKKPWGTLLKLPVEFHVLCPPGGLERRAVIVTVRDRHH